MTSGRGLAGFGRMWAFHKSHRQGWPHAHL